MTTSKYLPPFDEQEQLAVSRLGSGPPSSRPRPADADATYADFLGKKIAD